MEFLFFGQTDVSVERIDGISFIASIQRGVGPSNPVSFSLTQGNSKMYFLISYVAVIVGYFSCETPNLTYTERYESLAEEAVTVGPHINPVVIDNLTTVKLFSSA